MICALSRCIPCTLYLALVLLSSLSTSECAPVHCQLYNCTPVSPQVPKMCTLVVQKGEQISRASASEKSDASRAFSRNTRLLRRRGKLHVARDRTRETLDRSPKEEKNSTEEDKVLEIVVYARGVKGTFVRSRVERRPRWLALWSRLGREDPRVAR